MNGCLTCARVQTGKCYALCCYCRGDFQRLSEAQTQGLPDRHNKKVYSAQKKLHYLKYWSGKTLFVYLRQHLLLTGDDSPFSFFLIYYHKYDFLLLLLLLSEDKL
jgi:hypothetical protein